MAKVLDFKRKPPEFKEFHSMSVAREEDWLVWRCHTCSRKVKSSMADQDFQIERKGNFFAHHNYQCYQPTDDEFKKVGMDPVEFYGNFSFT